MMEAWRPADPYLARLVDRQGDRLRQHLEEWGLATRRFCYDLERWFGNFEPADKPLAEKLLWKLTFFSPQQFEDVLQQRLHDIRQHLHAADVSADRLLVLV